MSVDSFRRMIANGEVLQGITSAADRAIFTDTLDELDALRKENDELKLKIAHHEFGTIYCGCGERGEEREVECEGIKHMQMECKCGMKWLSARQDEEWLRKFYASRAQKLVEALRFIETQTEQSESSAAVVIWERTREALKEWGAK